METPVFWSLIPAGLIGVLLGIRFRAPAVIAASAIAVAANSTVAGWGDFFDRQVLMSNVLLVIVLQVAYLLGLSLVSAWRAR